MSKININKNSIIYNDIISSVDETGLLLDGGNWKINRDGSANFANVDGYIPNAGNTKSGELNLTRDTYTFNLPSSAPLLYTSPLSGHSFTEPVISVSNAAVSISYTSQSRKTGLMLINGKGYYLNPDNSQATNGREIAVKDDFDGYVQSSDLQGYIPNEGNIEDIDFTLQRKNITLKSNTYIETDSNVYDTLKGKTLLNSGAIYLELLDAPTYGSWNSQLGLNVVSGITWYRNHLKGNTEKYETQTQLNDSGYYLYTKNTTTDKMDSIYLQAGQLELVNNRVTDTSHTEGRVALSTTSLFITNGNNQVNLSCESSNIQLYLAGVNQNIRLSKDGLTFNGSDIPVENLYFSKDGIGYTTKEAYNRKTTYYLTSSATNISYKNQSQTGTLTFKPVDIDGEVQFKIANTIEDTTHSVTIYNGHTSTTQTEFNSTDYVTKQYVSSIVPDVDSCIPNEGNVLTSTDTNITRNSLTLKSMNTLISTGVSGAPDSYINLTPTHIILDNYRDNNELSSSIELSNSIVNIISKANHSVITLKTGNSDANKTLLELRGIGDGDPGLHYYYSKNSKTFRLDVSEKMFNGETNGGRVKVWNGAIGTQAELTLDDKFTVQYYANSDVTMLANGTSTFGDNEGVELYLVNGTGYLNKANAPKLYNDPTTELVIKEDLDNYVSKTEYNELKDGYDDLLEKYNDLADRLNAFLEATGNIEPDAENIIKTANIDNISFTITNQNADNDYIIDWGDGTTELSDKGTLAHTYNTTDNYMIKINSNNENATGTLSQAKDKIIEMDINTIGIPNIDDDDIITKIIVDNNVMYQGSWGDPFIQNADAISEIHIKKNCVINTYYPLCQNCPNLVKVIMDAEIKPHNNYLFEGCSNLTEVHLTNTTMPVFGESYSLFDTIPNNLQIYVPNNLVNDYKVALPDYANYIIGE